MTRMAAAKDSDSGTGIGRHAGINAPYYEYGYGPGIAMPIYLYTCMFMMSW